MKEAKWHLKCARSQKVAGSLGDWDLYDFGSPFLEKRLRITNTKLGMKVNIYLEWEKKSQQTRAKEGSIF